MSKMKKTGTAILSASLALTMLAACGSNSGKSADGGKNQEPQQPSQQQPVQEKPPEPKTITIYAINGDTEESFNLRFGDAIRKKYPHYTLNYIRNGSGNTLADMVASGRKYDITYHAIGFYENFVKPFGLEYDMTELIKKHGVDLNRFEQTSIEAIKQVGNGKIYSLPVYGNNLILYYNKAVFDKFGVAYPKDGMTWDEVFDISRKLTREDGGVQYYGIAFNPTFTIRMNQMSIPNANVEANTPTINTDERWKTFFDQYFVGWRNALGGGNFEKAPDQVMFLKDKNVGMSVYLSSVITISPEYRDFDWDMVALPSLKDNPGVGSQINSINFGIASNSDNKDDAMIILKFLTSDEHQATLSKTGVMPVLKDESIRKMLGSESAYKGKNFQAIFYNKPAPIPPKALYDSNMVSTYAKHGMQVFQGTVDVNTALRNAEEEAKQVIADYLKTYSGK